MWKIKEFKTFEAMNEWLSINQSKIQYEVMYILNGYAVEYRPLRRVY